MPRCPLCGQEIRWVTTKRGANFPLDPEPDSQHGSVFLHGEDVTFVRAQELRAARKAGEELYVPHWKHCAAWRKGKWGARKGEGT